MKRNIRAGVEDRWHREPRRGERVPYPADDSDPGCWCVDPRHGQSGTLVTTTRHGQGKRWLARWVDDGGNERSKAFDRKANAQQHITGVTTALATGTYADPQRSAVTFGTVAETWIKAKEAARRAPKTVGGYQSLLETLILPRWEDVPLRDIDHVGMQDWVTWLGSDPAARQRGKGDGLSPARVIQAHQVVHQILSYAIRAKYIAANPCDHIELPRKSAAEKIALSQGQVHQLARESGEVATMVYTLAYTGLRFGEVVALRVRDVDLDEKKPRLLVSRSITGVRGKGRLEGPTKTHQIRSAPILVRALVEALRDAIRDREPAEYLFPGPDGAAMTIGWFRVRFDKACAAAGLTGITPHTLRHSAGSLALAQGASVVTVQKLLGHRNATTTLNVYSHQLPDDFDNLAAAMDKAVRAAAG